MFFYHPISNPLLYEGLRSLCFPFHSIFGHIFSQIVTISLLGDSFGRIFIQNAPVSGLRHSFGHVFSQNVPVLRYENKTQANSSEFMFKVCKVLAKAYKVHGKSYKVLKTMRDLVRYQNLYDWNSSVCKMRVYKVLPNNEDLVRKYRNLAQKHQNLAHNPWISLNITDSGHTGMVTKRGWLPAFLAAMLNACCSGGIEHTLFCNILIINGVFLAIVLNTL